MTPTYTSARIKPGSRADLLRQMIVAQSGKPEGFSTTRHKGDHSGSKIYEACQWLIAKGLIFKARRSNRDIRFFGTQAAADAYLAATPAPKPVSASAPKQPGFARNAAIIHTAKTKYTIHPTPAPRFSCVDLPFNHGHLRAM